MMTITISDNPYYNRYQWRTQTQEKPVEDPMLVDPRPAPVQQAYLYADEDYSPVSDGGSASLAAALWEMESAKLAKANQQVGTVEPQSNDATVYGGGLLPIEVVRTQVLNRMGLTESDVAGMLPTERSSLESRVDAAVQEMRSAFNSRIAS